MRSSLRSSSGRSPGVPDNPAAWLMATAKHRAIDQLRRRSLHARKEDELTREIEQQLEAAAPAPVERRRR